MASYRSGACPVLIGSDGVVMTTVDGLEALTGAGGSAEGALSTLQSGEAPFAGVTVDADGLVVVVRGQFSVDVGGLVIVADGASGPVEHRVPWAPGVVVHSGHAPFGPSLPVSAGVVLATTLEWAPPEPEPVPEPEPEPGPAVEAPPTMAAAPSVVLVLPDGGVRDLVGVVVMGRAPGLQDGETGIVVDDPHVSATHVRLELRDGQVVATDLSTNGTLLKDPAATQYPLAKGVETYVPLGWTMWLASDYSVRVQAPSGGQEV